MFPHPLPSLQQVLASFLLLVERDHGQRTSGVLTIFWLLALVADGVRGRTIILQYQVR